MRQDGGRNAGGYTITPASLLFAGGCSFVLGVVATVAAGYRRSGKELLSEGVDPRVRSQFAVAAAKGLLGTTLLTGAIALGGFYAMLSLGVVQRDKQEVPRYEEALRRMTGRSGNETSSSSSQQP